MVQKASSALTLTHLREKIATESGTDEETLLYALAGMMQRITAGTHRPCVSELIAEAPLIASFKEDLSDRPIAVAKSYRRVISELMMIH